MFIRCNTCDRVKTFSPNNGILWVKIDEEERRKHPEYEFCKFDGMQDLKEVCDDCYENQKRRRA